MERRALGVGGGRGMPRCLFVRLRTCDPPDSHRARVACRRRALLSLHSTPCQSLSASCSVLPSSRPPSPHRPAPPPRRPTPPARRHRRRQPRQPTADSTASPAPEPAQCDISSACASAQIASLLPLSGLPYILLRKVCPLPHPSHASPHSTTATSAPIAPHTPRHGHRWHDGSRRQFPYAQPDCHGPASHTVGW